jgi:hypothetical protein
MAMGIPTLAAMAGNAAVAIADASIDEDDLEGLDKDFGDRFSINFAKRMAGYNRATEGYEKFLNDTKFFESITNDLKEWYKSSFIKQYENEEVGKEAYQTFHMQPRLKRYDPNDADFDADYANGQSYTDFVRNENGDIVYEDIGPPTAMLQELVDLSYKELSGAERTAIFGAVQAPFTAALGAATVVKGVRGVKIVDDYTERLRKSGNADKLRGPDGEMLNDMQIYKMAMKERDFFPKAWSKTWKGLFFIPTFGATVTGSGSLNVGRRMSTHLKNLDRYDTEITNLKEMVANPLDNLGSISAKGVTYRDLVRTIRQTEVPAERSAATRRIQTILEDDLKRTQKQLSSYANRAGTGRGRFKDVVVDTIDQDGETRQVTQRVLTGVGNKALLSNPYVTSMLGDDVIIATGIGYAPELIDGSLFGFEEGTVEALASLAFPIAAPYAFRKVTSLPGAMSTTARDIGVAIRSAPLVRIITGGDVENLNASQIEKVMRENGMPVDEESVKSTRILLDIHSQISPEFKPRVDRALNNSVENLARIEDNLKTLRRPEDNTRVYDDTQVNDIMNTLALTYAEATGLAPLLAYSQSTGKSIKPSDVAKPGKLDNLIAAHVSQEQSVKAIGKLSDLLNERLQVLKGIDVEGNEELVEIAEFFTNLHRQQNDMQSMRTQELQLLLSQFVKTADDMNPEVIDRIANFKVLLLPQEIRDTADKAKFVQETAMEISENARVEARVLAGLAEEMTEDEVFVNARSIADKLFDTEVGTKFTMGRLPYRAVDNYGRKDGKPFVLDMKELMVTLRSQVADLRDKDFSYILGKDFKFESGMGSQLEVAFERAAARGIRAKYGDDEIATMKSLLATDENPEPTFRDLAFDLLTDSGVNYFQATVSEAEMMYRVFRDHESVTQNKNIKSVDKALKLTVNRIYKEADPSGELFILVEKARRNWQSEVGEQLDPGRLAGDATIELNKKGGRRNVQTQGAAQGVHKYANDLKAPLEPFRRIAALSRKYLKETDDEKLEELERQIFDEQQKIVYFAGGGKLIGRDYGFVITNNALGRRRERNLDTVKSLISTLVSKRAIAQLQQDVKRLQVRSQRLIASGTGADPDTIKVTKEEAMKRLAKGNDYDFKRAERVNRLEEILEVQVDRQGFQTQPDKLLDVGSIKGNFRTIDEILETDENARATYTRIANEVNDQSSVLNEAARREVKQFEESAAYIPEFAMLAKDPLGFYKSVFKRTTEAKLQKTVEDVAKKMVASGEVRSLPDARNKVKRSLAFMYHRGVVELTSPKVRTSPDGETMKILDDADVFEQIINDKNQRPIIQYLFEDDGDYLENLEILAQYQRSKSGDAMGFRSDPDIRALGLDSLFSRVFNIARGLVSVPYVATEITGRMMLMKRQSLLQLSLRDKKAASVLAKMIRTPDEITRKDLKLLNLRMKIYLGAAMLRSGGEIESIDQFFGEETTSKLGQRVEEQFLKDQEALEEELMEQDDENVQ